MRLTCPACGAWASLEAWALDDDARATVAGLTALPAGVNSQAVRYLGLFRKPDSPRGLSWGRARRLVEELAECVNAKTISWDSGQELRNLPAHWEQAMAAILERDSQGKVKRPLTNHNLLRCIAYEQASKAAEAKRKYDEAMKAYPVPSAKETRERPSQAEWDRNAAKAQEVLAKLRNKRA